MRSKLTQISERVWFWPHHTDPERLRPCLGIVVSDRGIILVYAGSSPGLAGLLTDVLDQANLLPVHQIIYTHHHWDQVYGACTFDVPVVAHRLWREMLL